MKISFEEELDRRSLILEKENISANEYVYPMLAHNQIQELLPVRIKSKNGENCLSYDVTSGISLTDTFAARSMNSSEVRRVLFGLRDAVSSLAGCLLDSRDLCLDPDEIFLFSSPECVRFCFVPHLSETQAHSVRQLSEFLLRHADHSDSTAVELVYSFYEEVSRENYSLSDILRQLLSQAEVPDGSGDKARKADSSTLAGRNYSNNPVRNNSGSADQMSGFNVKSGQPSFGRPSGGRSVSRQPDFSLSAEEYASPGRTFSEKNTASGKGADGRWQSESSPPNRSAAMPKQTGRSIGRHGSSGSTSGSRDTGRNTAGAHSANRNAVSRRTKGRNRGRTASAALRKRRGSGTGAARQSGSKRRSGFQKHRTLIILCACTAVVAVAVSIIFHFDLVQIAGMGFLCAAAVWLIYGSLHSRSADVNNVWADELADEPDDDTFYQNLLHEMYQTDNAGPGMTAAGTARAGTSAPDSHQSGTYASMEKDSATPDGATRLVSGAETSVPLLISDHPGTVQNISLEKGHLLIGKNEAKVDVVLNSSVISRIHARLDYSQEDGLTVTDLFSTNGTFVGGRRLEANRPATLTNGQRLSFANLSFRVLLPEQSADQLEKVSKAD